jgi:FAS-associated factor 2
MQALASVFNYIFTLFKSCFTYPLRRLTSSSQYQPLSTQESAQLPQYQIEARRFLQKFNLKYGDNHPVFFVGVDAQDAQQQSTTTTSSNMRESVFFEVMDKAKKEYKLVLVYLHSDQHQNTSQFCQNVFCTDSFKEYIDGNFMCFAADATSSDGYLLTNLLSATTFPFLAVLINIGSKYEVVFRIEGENAMNLDALIAKLIDVHENTMPRLIVQQNEDNERIQHRLQREEQDRAYQEAIEEDRRRQEERQRREEEERRRIEEAQQRLLNKQQRIARIAQERLTLRQNFPAEPSAQDKENGCLIRFKFPDGSQLQRRFLKTDKVKIMYQFVHTVNVNDLDKKSTSWKPHESSDLENYELATSFPKTILNPEKTLAESQCYPQALVLVREDNEAMHEQIEETAQ